MSHLLRKPQPISAVLVPDDVAALKQPLQAAQRCWRACFGLFENRHDLAVRASRLLHGLNLLIEEILLLITAVVWGIVLASLL